MSKKQLVSIIIPAYNESENVDKFYGLLTSKIDNIEDHDFEFIYVNDGSTDDTQHKISALTQHDSRVRLLSFSRNFGKEIATTAGIEHARGDAIIMIDADGQHPPELIQQFLDKWHNGAQVVIGVRQKNQKEGLVKHLGSKLFYLLMKSNGSDITPGSTDFSLIDACVQQQLSNFGERSRITRGLIEWLGFKRDYIYFDANPRMGGKPTYKFTKLLQLALDSFISTSLKPLHFSFYAGAAITLLSLLLGVFVGTEQLLLHDPLGLRFTGTAMLSILILLLVGIILSSQGVMALYISRIHVEAQGRPLYVINAKESVRV